MSWVTVKWFRGILTNLGILDSYDCTTTFDLKFHSVITPKAYNDCKLRFVTDHHISSCNSASLSSWNYSNAAHVNSYTNHVNIGSILEIFDLCYRSKRQSIAITILIDRIIIVYLLNFSILIKHNRHIYPCIAKLLVLKRLYNSIRYQIHTSHPYDIIKSINLFLKECALYFSSSLINHINIHQLALSFIIVPRPSIRFLKNSYLYPPITLDEGVQSLYRNVTTLVEYYFVIFYVRHVFHYLIIWNLHPCL